MSREGSLIIVSGPSGAGKSALAASVLRGFPGIRFSVSYTTRTPRGNEREGLDYCFISEAEFENRIRRGDFLEWAEVYGNYYGTSRSFIHDTMTRGEDVLLDVDVQGARTIRGLCPESISIFIMPPSYQVLRARLESRKLDKEYIIEKRLKIARREIAQYRSFDYLIVNDAFDASVEEFKAIIGSSRCRMTSRAGIADTIVATFGGVDAEYP
jgi:guanylate kinase